jgi:phenylacetate-CoA ligase
MAASRSGPSIRSSGRLFVRWNHQGRRRLDCSDRYGDSRLGLSEGREADCVTTADGEPVFGISLTENFAMLVPGIAQLQIVQEELDRFVFRIVRDEGFGPASLDRIAALVAERFGPETRYHCEFVDRIPQEPSGKYRFCISKVPNAFARPRPVETSAR